MFDALDVGIGELEAVDLDGMPASVLSELVEGMDEWRCRYEAAEARILARWDANRCWELDGAKSGGAWLAWKRRLPSALANQKVRHARAVRDLPELATAWAAGEIDRPHLVSILGCRTPRTEEHFADGLKLLVDAARTLHFRDFLRVCRTWTYAADPDGAEDGAKAGLKARDVSLGQSFGGMWFGKMTFDPISGTIVNETLIPIERELFEADWAEAKERLGREPTVVELRRTPGQRRADAMVEMATRARTAPVGGRRPGPLFTVVVGYETFAGPVCELWNRTMVTPGSLNKWLSEAEVERVVFDSPSRVIDVGARRRFFRGALRRAIEVRDRTCFHPTCVDPPVRGQIDHEDEYGKGGETTQANGRLGCGFHNRLRNTRPDDWTTPGGPEPPGD